MNESSIKVQESNVLPRIVYIMGTGRSGTTILEVLIRNNPEIFGAGEITHIFRDGFLKNKECSCGKATLNCEVWGRVLEKNQWSAVEVKDFEKVFSNVTRHGAFPLIALGIINRERQCEFEIVNKKLFSSIKEVTGANIIVDSSKYPSRALFLAEHYPGDIKILCMTRSPSGLISAFGKQHEEEQKPKSLIMASIYYLYVLMCMYIVKQRLRDQCYILRYEDLRSDPIGILTGIQKWGGYNLNNSIELLKNNEWFDIGHIVTGNRLRKMKQIKYEYNDQGNEESDKVNIIVRFLNFYRKFLKF